MKPERIQFLPVTPERLHTRRGEITGWEVDTTPNAIFRHFPQPSFTASAAFLQKAAPAVEKHGRVPFFFGDASGVTVRLGNAPLLPFAPLRGDVSGVTEADLDLAAALTAID